VLLTDLLPDAVEVLGVVEARVVRRQVRTAPKPLVFGVHAVLAQREIPEVGVDGRHVRRARMHDQGQAGGVERGLFHVKLAGHAVGERPVDRRGVDPALLEHVAPLYDGRNAAASLLPRPPIHPERGPIIPVVERPDDPDLQGLYEPLHAMGHGNVVAGVLAQGVETVEVIAHGAVIGVR